MPREWLVIKSSDSAFAGEPSGKFPRDVAEKLLGRDLGDPVLFTRDESMKMRAHPEFTTDWGTMTPIPGGTVEHPPLTDTEIAALRQLGLPHPQRGPGESFAEYLLRIAIEVLQMANEKQKQGADPNVERVAAALAQLTDERRLGLFHRYCVHCGTEGSGCQCWNDE